MVAAAWGGAQEADLALLIVDARAGLTDEVRAIVDRLRRAAGRHARAEQGRPGGAAAACCLWRRS
jgi:GTPase Era involved in 16S rRNA processing